MAGSYKHCENGETGRFTFELIENLGDAYEACHEMFFIIRWLTEGDQSLIDEALEDYGRCLRGEQEWPDWCGPWLEERKND